MMRRCLLGLLSLGLPCVVLVAQAATDRNPALNAPDEFAWKLFVELNAPAKNGTRDVIWETWATHANLYGNPNATPVWPGVEHRAKTLSPSVQREILNQESRAHRSGEREILRQQGVAPAEAPEFVPSNPLAQEVRMNRATFDFIVQNQLWYRQGQEARFREGKPVSFPIDSKEIKADWRPIQPADKPRYHWQVGADGKTYGLAALHIITKDLPNWTWATFEQEDNPERCHVLECRDAFGLGPDGQTSPELSALFAAAGMGDEWKHYRLDGTQTDFTDSTGRPTLLGNSITEDGFVSTSSCITCHARATVNASGQRLPVFDENRQSHNGAPDPAWFWTSTPQGQQPRFLQLDFVWSLMFARTRTAPLPEALQRRPKRGAGRAPGSNESAPAAHARAEVPLTVDSRPALPHNPKVEFQDICGDLDDSQDVESYDGSLGVSKGYVQGHEPSTVQLRWLSSAEITARLPGYSTGDVGSAKWCSGTLIMDRYVLTAGHCVEPQKGGDEWTTPFLPKGDDRDYASPDVLAKLQTVTFNFQANGKTGQARTGVTFPVIGLVEQGDGLDYAILEIGADAQGKPASATFASSLLETRGPTVQEAIALIQHPDGRPKKVDAGHVLRVEGSAVLYDDVDTMGGSSGSGVRDKDGHVIGVHTNGGCAQKGGANLGVTAAAIAAVSNVF